MAKCPHCDSIKINIFLDIGNGKCSTCHGSGLGDTLDQFASNIVRGESLCKDCNGSGECTFCDGSGLIDE